MNCDLNGTILGKIFELDKFKKVAADFGNDLKLDIYLNQNLVNLCRISDVCNAIGTSEDDSVKRENERQFICNFNESSKEKGNLNRHKIIHSSEKTYKCDIDKCELTFRLYSHLFHHKNLNHYLIKRHKCFHKDCNQWFVTSSQLKKHILVNHSAKKF